MYLLLLHVVWKDALSLFLYISVSSGILREGSHYKQIRHNLLESAGAPHSYNKLMKIIARRDERVSSNCKIYQFENVHKKRFLWLECHFKHFVKCRLCPPNPVLYSALCWTMNGRYLAGLIKWLQSTFIYRKGDGIPLRHF